MKPEDFSYHEQNGTTWQAATALSVVNNLLAKAGRHDVIKLVTTYERGVYGNEHMQSTNGYESRRQAAVNDGGVLAANRYHHRACGGIGAGGRVAGGKGRIRRTQPGTENHYLFRSLGWACRVDQK